LWTTPASQEVLRAVLEKTAPEKVYLFAVDPGLDSLESFLKRLTGLIKSSLTTEDGWVKPSKLAAATAQREATVRAGLSWLEGQGHLVVLEGESDDLHLAEGSRDTRRDLRQATAQLRALLQETAAYRAFFVRADGETAVSARGAGAVQQV
jgi:hypothetical protein